MLQWISLRSGSQDNEIGSFMPQLPLHCINDQLSVSQHYQLIVIMGQQRVQNYLIRSLFIVFFCRADHIVGVDCFNMCVERALLSIALLADFAYKRTLASMLSHMIVEISLRAGRVIACFTFERLFPRVNPHVNLYRLLLCKTFAAHVTMVWTFSRMSPKHFRQKIFSIIETRSFVKIFIRQKFWSKVIKFV